MRGRPETIVEWRQCEAGKKERGAGRKRSRGRNGGNAGKVIRKQRGAGKKRWWSGGNAGQARKNAVQAGNGHTPEPELHTSYLNARVSSLELARLAAA